LPAAIAAAIDSTAATSSGSCGGVDDVSNGVLNNNYNFMKLFAFIVAAAAVVVVVVIVFIALNKNLQQVVRKERVMKRGERLKIAESLLAN